MDDSDLRRWNPTCHNKFDEETAVLQHLAGAKPNGLGSISKSVGVLF